MLKCMKETRNVKGFALVKTLEEKTASNGKPYLDLVLGDSEGDVKAKMWSASAETCGFEALDLVAITGTADEYNGEAQLKIASIRKAVPSDGVNIEEYIASAPYAADAMLKVIESYVEAFEDDDYKELVDVFIEKNREQLMYWPAATKMHHAVRGGLLYHTSTMLKLADAVSKIYPDDLNRDLLFTGVILHDFAKMEEISSTELGIATDYSVKGNLLGHLVMGAMNVEKIGTEIGIPAEKLMLVQHMLISHHGKPEWGACKLPMFPEAEVLSTVDLLDARMYEMRDALKEVEPGTLSPKCFAMGNVPLYKLPGE